MPERHHHHHHYYGRDREGYAFHAGEPGPGPNHHKLYKDPNNKVIAGVCSGIANYYGWRRADGVRIVWALSFFVIGPFTIIGYILAAILLKPAPAIPVYQSPDEERFWRTFSTRPKATFSELKHRFRAIDTRLSDLESAVVSDEYGLRKAFRDLESGA
jgi:phage shock protein C